MPRTIDYDPGAGLLLIQFPYDRALIQVVRGLPGRRWQPRAKCWAVPIKHLDEVCERLSMHEFEITGEVAALFAQRSATPPQSFKDAREEPEARTPIPEEAASFIQNILKPRERPKPPPQASGLPAQLPQLARPAETPRAPSGGIEEALTTLRRHARPSSSSPRPTGTPLTAASARPTATPKSYQVSALNNEIRAAIRSAFPTEVWVVGELSGFDRSRNRRHVFFDLLERPEEGVAEVSAQASAVIWAKDRSRVEQRLTEAKEPFELCDGLQVRLKVAVDFYAIGGRFQLIVKDIDPVFTLGQLALRREDILRELALRGLVEQNRARPMPLAPTRVALVTSPDSEGARDFLHELARSGVAFEVDLYGVRVQGMQLASMVCSALARIHARSDRYDVVAIVRGGGSRADLAWFDQLDVAVAVATLPVKVVVGIGHHRDQSVLDFIAHSEKTPTAAGKHLVQCIEQTLAEQAAVWQLICDVTRVRLAESQEGLRGVTDSLTQAFQHHLHLKQMSLTTLHSRFFPLVRQHLKRADERLQRSSEELVSKQRVALRGGRRELDRAEASLNPRRIRARLHRRQAHLDELSQRLIKASQHQLQTQRQALDVLEARRRLLDPLRLLARGFARLSHADTGERIRSVEALRSGDRLRIELRDGALRALVEDIEDPNDPQ